MFCAGNDLHDFLNSPPDLANSPVVDFLYAMRDFPKPLIMAVNGVAVGISVTMLCFTPISSWSVTMRATDCRLSTSRCVPKQLQLDLCKTPVTSKPPKTHVRRIFTAEEAMRNRRGDTSCQPKKLTPTPSTVRNNSLRKVFRPQALRVRMANRCSKLTMPTFEKCNFCVR